jgi:TrmH family RNA methyltransferase
MAFARRLYRGPMPPRPATEEDLALFASLKGKAAPPGRFIGEGGRVVRRMLEHGVAERVLCTPEWAGRLAAAPEVELALAEAATLERIVGFRLHSGVLAMGRIPPLAPFRGSLIVALDRLANAENVGSVLRACAAFGAGGVVVGPGTASPWLRRAVRVSVAAPLTVPCRPVEDLARFCREHGNAWAAHIHGPRRDYREVDYRGEVCLVLGSEADGVSEPVLSACRGTIYIPMAPDWDCLNVGASAAVLLAETERQRSVAGGKPGPMS